MGARELWLIRHGESVANVAAANAERAGLDRISVDFRDADVPLSGLGARQAEALGVWLASNLDTEVRPQFWTSSYFRAIQTISIAVGEAGFDDSLRVDDRLRDRELGVMDLLTSHGVESLLPEEAARRRWLGKFYYRPPGGESWVDLALRVRSVLHDLDATARERADGPVVLATHDAVVMVFIYLCRGMSEAELLDFTKDHTVTNASVTRLSRPTGNGLWTLDTFSDDDHLRDIGVPVTEHPGDKDDNVL